jgi:hypothetical protein
MGVNTSAPIGVIEHSPSICLYCNRIIKIKNQHKYLNTYPYHKLCIYRLKIDILKMNSKLNKGQSI